MAPTIANNSINKDIINHKDILVYNILPIAVISIFSIIKPSHELWEIYEIYSLDISTKVLYINHKKILFIPTLTLINIKLIGMYIYIPISKLINTLFIVSVCNSEILISINIKINKNSIDTAPIYTNK